ncbi:MAG TPA: transglutaminase family protein [Paracoccaceae bacterium]|nr:transglutaminase family protein [Paracoccaceae bacterium]
MLYDIAARISYAYDQPALAGRNLLRLLPADIPGRQRLIAGQVSAHPAPAERRDRTDFFGNAVTEFTFRAPAPATDFILRARVERLSQGPVLDLSPPLDALPREIDDQRTLAPDAPHHFLGRSPRVQPVAAITAFAESATAGFPTTRAAVEALGRALHARMTFDPEATTVDTPAAEAFAKSHGVCQDFAHIMIGALRALGVPAAYVSGYLRTVPPAGQPRLEGADAMHAWVRAWTGSEIGWVEYDPTNAIWAGSGHVLVAWGRDYEDVAPVQGVLRTSGAQRSSQSVDTIPLSPGP